MSQRRVGVFPPAQMHVRRRLLGALEEAFPVKFEERRAGELRGIHGAMCLDGDSATARDLVANGTPVLLAAGGGARAADSDAVRFGRHERVDTRLRDRILHDARAIGLDGVDAEQGDVVVAASGDAPLWVTRARAAGRLDVVALPPQELADDAPLKRHLRAGCFLDLLPLVEFLRSMSGNAAWQPPSLRACFLFDDPNLHATSYGFIDYATLVRHARRHRYHATFATIPLDSWLVREPAARIFRENPDQLTLLIHGNDHLKRELAQPRPRKASLALLAQALRRTRVLEAKSRVDVARVMAAPHGVASEESLAAMRACGFDAAVINRPYPWLARPPAERPLAGWEIGDLVAGGMAILPRFHLTGSAEEVLLRGYLGQPLVLYGHHTDLGGGLGLLEERVERLRQLGDVRWSGPARLAETNYLTRQEGRTLRVRALSRRVIVEVPDGAEEIVVETPTPHGDPVDTVVTVGNHRARLLPTTHGLRTEALPVGPERAEIRLADAEPVDVTAIPDPPRRAWPIVRRVLAESRDRASPLLKPRRT